MANITVVKGDVTEPKGDGQKLIVHSCNDINAFGSGVASSIAKKWPHVKYGYHEWAKDGYDFYLGQIHFIKAEDNIVVCNLIGQRSIGGETIDGEFLAPVRYEAIYEGLLRIRARIKNYTNISLHFPLIGCGLAKGDWYTVYGLVEEVFHYTPVDITIYAFNDSDLELAQAVQKYVALERRFT